MITFVIALPQSIIEAATVITVSNSRPPSTSAVQLRPAVNMRFVIVSVGVCSRV